MSAPWGYFKQDFALQNWAYLASKMYAGGLGYPSSCAFARLTPSDKNKSYANLEKENWAEQVNTALLQMPLELQQLAAEVYKQAGGARLHAQRLNICRQTLQNRWILLLRKLQDAGL